jgi:hypothetical protein
MPIRGWDVPDIDDLARERPCNKSRTAIDGSGALIGARLRFRVWFRRRFGSLFMLRLAGGNGVCISGRGHAFGRTVGSLSQPFFDGLRILCYPLVDSLNGSRFEFFG